MEDGGRCCIEDLRPSPSEWTRMFDVVSCCEGRMKSDASRMINPRVQIDVSLLRKNHAAPKLDIRRQLR
jgi:hypothetical protein